MIEVKIAGILRWRKLTPYTKEKSYLFYDKDDNQYTYYTNKPTKLDEYDPEELEKGGYRLRAKVKSSQRVPGKEYYNYVISHPTIIPEEE